MPENKLRLPDRANTVRVGPACLLPGAAYGDDGRTGTKTVYLYEGDERFLIGSFRVD